ncbi:hypothetical protein SRB521_00762 [Intestinimonas butyriciproducens]|uniref:Mobilization protein MobC n=1 Tax=Intestinimonas butyriciproducens TaxID=1297617 RepID=A0A2U1BIR3_9FIRM|nr:mobilization protein MobC [Intestinimonas butyriciproducens]QBB65026.1 hypothetical protein SRB521_00762 [Intestinimonas butyriciproducens]
MRSVLIGFEYPVTDTPYFCFLQNLYCNLCRGVADSYAFSRFHDNVGLRDFLAVWHFKGPDAVVVDDHLLIGHAILLFGVVHINDELLSAVGKLTAEYGRIGGNLNQIARYLNEYGVPYNTLSGEVRAAISDLAVLKYEVLKKVGDAVGNTQAYQL